MRTLESESIVAVCRLGEQRGFEEAPLGHFRFRLSASPFSALPSPFGPFQPEPVDRLAASRGEKQEIGEPDRDLQRSGMILIGSFRLPDISQFSGFCTLN